MKFKKKPVVIEAYKFENKVGSDTRPGWLHQAIKDGIVYYQGGKEEHLTIETLDGKMKVNIGDFIIKGVNGELYPCKPDIFEKTYEVVNI